METYICNNVFVPLRSAPTHKSEMDSQLLFGEKFMITDRVMNWAKAKTMFDGCEGWFDTNHLWPIACVDTLNPITIGRRLVCLKDDNSKIVIEAGSDIYNPDFSGRFFFLNNDKYFVSGEFGEDIVSTGRNATDIATDFLNTPYLWGGRTACGIDCSGLTQIAYKIMGKVIPRNGYKQAEIGTNISFLEESLPGDLAFFDNESGKISHVGIIAQNNTIIHSSGKVRIDPIDHQGIYRGDLGRYSHKLRMIKRIV